MGPCCVEKKSFRLSFRVAAHSPANQHFASARAFFGTNKTSVADTNKETPATARPPYKLPVLSLIAPIAYGPISPPRLAMEVINAMPEAAEYPVRNSLGIVQKGPRKL